MSQTIDSSVDRIHLNLTNTTSGWCKFDDFVLIPTRNNNVSILVYRHSQVFAVHRPTWRSFIWQLNSMDQFSFKFTDIKNIRMSDNVQSINQSVHRDLPSMSQRVNVIHIDVRWFQYNDIQLIIPTRDSSDGSGCRLFLCVEITSTRYELLYMCKVIDY